MPVAFDSVELTNVVTYKQATLPLNKYPLILIRGLNKDRRSKNSSNAVGKSLIVSAIPTLRYGSPPTVDAKRSASIMHSKGSIIKLGITNNGKKYVLSQFQKGKSVAYDVEQDDKALKYRESKEAFDRIASLIPMSEAQFYSFVYLDARRSHPLHIGTAAQRFAFFEQAFNLDIYDKIAKKVNQEYNGLKFQIQQLRESESDYAQKAATFSKREVRELKDKRENLVKKAEKVRNRVDSYLKELRLITAYMTLAVSVDTKISDKELRRLIKEAESDEIMLEKRYEASVKYWASVEENEINANKHRTIAAKINKLKDLIAESIAKFPFLERYAQSTTGIDADIEQCTRNIAKLSEQYQKLQEDNRIYKSLAKKKAAFDIGPKRKKKYASITTDRAKAKVAQCSQQIKNMNKALEDLESHEDANCPTCFRNLDKKTRDTIIANCHEQISKFERQKEAWEEAISYIKILDQLKTVANDYEIEPLKKRLDKEKYKKKRLAYYSYRLKSLQNLRESKALLPNIQVKKIKIGKPEVYKDTLADLRQRLKKYNADFENRVKIKELSTFYSSYDEAKVRYEQLQAYIDKYQPLLSKAQEALHNMTVKLTRSESLEKDLKALSKRITNIKDATADYSIYEALREAYGAQGLRKVRTAMLAATFEQNLNKFASLLFAEPIKFSILVGHNQFSILAERNGKPAADVKTLSGSEGRCFVLLTLLSLLDSVPANARTNLLVLDEMESLLDLPSRNLLISEFLPTINSVIPNIVVVTSHTKSEFSIPHAVAYQVTKRNGVSSLTSSIK